MAYLNEEFELVDWDVLDLRTTVLSTIEGLFEKIQISHIPNKEGIGYFGECSIINISRNKASHATFSMQHQGCKKLLLPPNDVHKSVFPSQQHPKKRTMTIADHEKACHQIRKCRRNQKVKHGLNIIKFRRLRKRLGGGNVALILYHAYYLLKKYARRKETNTCAIGGSTLNSDCIVEERSADSIGDLEGLEVEQGFANFAVFQESSTVQMEQEKDDCEVAKDNTNCEIEQSNANPGVESENANMNIEHKINASEGEPVNTRHETENATSNSEIGKENINSEIEEEVSNSEVEEEFLKIEDGTDAEVTDEIRAMETEQEREIGKIIPNIQESKEKSQSSITQTAPQLQELETEATLEGGAMPVSPNMQCAGYWMSLPYRQNKGIRHWLSKRWRRVRNVFVCGSTANYS